MSEPDGFEPAPQQRAGALPMYLRTSAPEHPDGTMILVLGLVSLACGVTGPVAWYLGSRAERQIRAGGVGYADTQNIQIGKVVGMITTIVMIVGAALVLVWLMVMLIAMGSLISALPHR